MALFGLFGKKNAIRCAKCNTTIKQDDIRGHQGKVYCSFCYEQILAEERRSTARASTTTARTGSTAGTPKRPPRTITVDTTHDYREMPQRLKQIKEAFDHTDTKYSMNHFGDQWEIVAGVNGKSNVYELKFICKEDPNCAIAIRVFNLANVDESRTLQICQTLNRLNGKYRFVRFTLDSDNAVKVEYDVPVETSDVGPYAMEMLLRIVSIIDDAYPELMRDLWN